MTIYKNTTKILCAISLVFILSGCGGGDTGTNTDTDTDSNFYDTDTDTDTGTQDPIIIPTTASDSGLALNDWRKPRVIATASANTTNNDKVFSLMPKQNNIRVRLLDITSRADPNTYTTIRAAHTRDPNIIITLTYDTATKKWLKDDAPVAYKDKTDIYPTYWIEAINDANGSVVAKDKIVLYDGKTENCAACHSSSSGYTLAYANNPVNLADSEEDYKFNILRVHDTNYPNAVNDTQSALQAKGINYYDNAGLEATAKKQKISCTDCHGINGVQGSGLRSVPSLTNALHKVHANKPEPNIIGAKNCLTCHGGDTIQKSFNGKIIHALDSRWWRSEDGHGEWAEDRGVASCTLCHGTDLRGTDISNNDRGSCYRCHGKEW